MQTAMQSHLQWLNDNQLDFNIPLEVIEDAEYRLEMEKQQIIDANYDGQRLHSKSCTKQMLQDNAESYFDETYGSNGSDETNGNNLEKVANVTSSQTEISDEEIEKEADYYSFAEDSSAYVDFIEGAKWYREQLKKKQ